MALPIAWLPHDSNAVLILDKVGHATRRAKNSSSGILSTKKHPSLRV
eukprot:CAMPEP_0202508956 /NCGR_PEP_ID=MMETSP1361-20130828/52519_1 /ASSEMBLY_ACC=CAM_ASM_000849 /TAXON_ID=210615 /ORGANISM="Staurosira complex sp., Strain CCMP2646" /LENGTH=46 /DNA_ID= /DNA_START= /DNA_END= /DNA_ORIENTATION=